MKSVFFFICLCLLFSCDNKYGYIYDFDNRKPLEGVIVEDINTYVNKIETGTDGKFSFSECGNLIIKKEGYKTDTLEKYGCKPDGKCFDGHIFYMKRIKDK